MEKASSDIKRSKKANVVKSGRTQSKKDSRKATQADKQNEKRDKTADKTRSKPPKATSGKHKRKNNVRTVSAWWFIVPALILLLTAVLTPLLMRSDSCMDGAEVPAGRYDYAVDISKYQKDINWDSLMVMTDTRGKTIKSISKAVSIRRVRYVMIKATEGRRMQDRLFHEHWDKARKAGYGRGAYHFFRSSVSADEQAANFIKTVGNIRHRDLAPILDVETVHRGCSRVELNDGIRTWLRTVENHYRRRPIIYTSDSFIKDWLDADIVRDYPVWVARYGGKEPRHSGWVLWQFTDKAAVYGIPSHCDLSVISQSFSPRD